MTKKIRDIKPPKKNSKPKKIENSSKTIKNKFNWKKLWFLILTPILFGGILFFCDLTKAEIKIWPRKIEKDISTTVEITNKEQEGFDGELWLDKKIIPGRIVTSTQNVNGSFESSGIVEEKAKGVIKIYNNYSSAPQAFRAQTRLISEEGKVFRIPERVTVPGKPGSVDVEVVAAEPGEEYNIEPSTFSIPGLSGTALYGQFIGKSFQKMKGGGTYPQIMEEDINISKRQLSKKAVDQLQKEFDQLKILFNSASIEIKEFNTSNKENDKIKQFTASLKAEIKALGFKESNIENFARAYILDQIPTGNKIISNTLNIDYQIKDQNLEEGKISLKLDIFAKTYKDIKEAIIKKGLINKNISEAEIFLKNQEGINDVKVNLWPFWIKQIPGNKNKIKVKLILD